MTARAQHYHPDLEEVLRDVARDPRAKLLRVPTSGDLVRAFRDEPVGPAAPGLVAAERHLLAVHRAELAFLLRERCVMELFAAPDAEYTLERSVTLDRELEVPEGSEWRSRAQGALELAQGPELALERDLLAACVDVPLGRAGITELALASRRIEKAPQPWVYASIEATDERRWQEALRFCRSLVEEGASRFHQSYAWHQAGRALGLSGRHSDSRFAFEVAVECGEGRVLPLLDWLAQCVMDARAEDAAEACRRIDEFIRSDHSVVERHVASLRWRRSRGELGELTQEARTVLDPIRASAGETSTRILDALA